MSQQIAAPFQGAKRVEWRFSEGFVGKLLIGDDEGVCHEEGHSVPYKEENGKIPDHGSIETFTKDHRTNK